MGLMLMTMMLFSAVFGYNWCPPLGPALPPSQQLQDHADVQDAVAELTSLFKDLTATYTTSATSLSLAIAYEENTILDLHHVGAGLNQSGTLSSTTIPSIASAVSAKYTLY